MQSYSGMLLVATPQLVDPNFWRTVVLILQHDDEGCVGVVLNRLTDHLVADHLPGWVVDSTDGMVHYGGPVEPEVAIGLQSGGSGDDTGVTGLGLLDLEQEAMPREVSEARIYSGYAGWSAGQLEAELALGSWFVIPAEASDPFGDPNGLWAAVLRRQDGPLALVATYPEDISLN